MKHSLIHALSILIVVFIFSSCSSYMGLTNNVNNHQTEVVLSQKNYKIIKYVEGESSARYILGIGGAGKFGMIAKARENMLRNAGLVGKSRAVINETVELKTKLFFVYTEVRYIVSAYIVEFYHEGDIEPTVEENVYLDAEEPMEKTITTNGVSAGLNFQQSNYYAYNTYYISKPGFHLGLKAEFNKPNTFKYFFWETQLNLSYIAFERLYASSQSQYNTNYNEKSVSMDIPFLVGYKFPVTQKIACYIKAGPALGITLYNLNKTGYENNQSVGFLHTSNLQFMTGLQLGSHYQFGIGHRWCGGGYSEYNFTKVSLSYLF